MPTIIHIHGGEARSNEEEFVTHLYNTDIDLTKTDQKKRSRRYDEIFPYIPYHRPEMPCALNAKYAHRKIWFDKYLSVLTTDLVLIGHSLGANFLAKRLAENKLIDHSCSADQLHLVAGCYGRKGGFELMDNFPGFLPEQIENIHIYHSHDDDIVSIKDAYKYHDAIEGSRLHEFLDRHHFLQPDFPELRDTIRTGL